MTKSTKPKHTTTKTNLKNLTENSPPKNTKSSEGKSKKSIQENEKLRKTEVTPMKQTKSSNEENQDTPIPTTGANSQPPEKAIYDPKGIVDVVRIWPSIQGEGPFHGLKAVFIRLAGCDLQCPGCDTDYTTGRVRMTPPKIVGQCQAFMRRSLVVITGGEPFRQNIAPLVRMLLNTGYYVQIESNGTMMPPPSDGKTRFPWEKVIVVCSPKTANLHPDFAAVADYFKYILDAEHVAEDGLPSSTLGMNQQPARPPKDYDIPVYVQPMDHPDMDKTVANVSAVVNSCMKFNYRVCLQLHKLLGLD